MCKFGRVAAEGDHPACSERSDAKVGETAVTTKRGEAETAWPLRKRGAKPPALLLKGLICRISGSFGLKLLQAMDVDSAAC